MPCPRHFACWCPRRRRAAAASRGRPRRLRPRRFPRSSGKALDVLDRPLDAALPGFLPLLAKGDLTTEPFRGAGRFRHRSRRPIARDLGEPSTLCRRCRTGQACRYRANPGLAFQRLVPGEQGKPVGANQLQLGIERTFGGLGEAFGLGPMRELQQAWREMLTASIAKQRAASRIPRDRGAGLGEGTQGLLQELQAMGARGERVESLLAFIRLWAKAIDGPMHDAMQDARGLASDGQADQCVYAAPPATAEGDRLGERGHARADPCRHGQRLPRNPGTQTRTAATQESTAARRAEEDHASPGAAPHERKH